MSNREYNVRRFIYVSNTFESSQLNAIALQELMLEMVPTDFHEKCTACPISEECYAPVPGVGNVEADVAFIGRNPGKDEDRQGLPFVGRGGALLDNFIRWVGLDRNNLYITNLVKCFTDNNRPPKLDEIKTCVDKWLKPEFEFLHPKLIVTFGAEACSVMTGGGLLKDKRMNMTTYTAEAGNLAGVSHIACVHPGAAIRNTGFYRQFRDDSAYVKAQCTNLGIWHTNEP